jgi:hypothetical protein
MRASVRGPLPNCCRQRAISANVIGVLNSFSNEHGDSYYDETAFRWSERVCSGGANRQTRKGAPSLRSTKNSGLRVVSRVYASLDPFEDF